ncbi:hypothetical protein ERJ75_001174200 [Trypanosoma vivax]|uniref:C2H2-type domain-containing protein n=1 Tax=Trypanosoma vivax (strain Y486) TaxID=1055687 RepID=G0UCF5_TRYVY|nr:hypothetical protein ERJ75_001174200 [Trypanosoma vivax]CCC53507.1 hypothetical protein TVY486_1109910 [Trypanosoma vivax Y486]
MEQCTPDVVPTVEERPKRDREEDATDDGNAIKCPWCARKNAAHAWLRRHMTQKHPEKQLSSGPNGAQDAPESDGYAAQEEQEEKQFVCQQCRRVLKSKTWLTRHKCEAASIMNSEGSNIVEQSVTVVRPICSKEYHYRWLLRHMLTKHLGHDDSLRSQPRVKPARERSQKKVESDVCGDGNSLACSSFSVLHSRFLF